MRVTNMTAPDGSGDWRALRLEVAAPSRPVTRVEVTTGRRMVLRQDDRPLPGGVAAWRREVDLISPRWPG